MANKISYKHFLLKIIKKYKGSVLASLKKLRTYVFLNLKWHKWTSEVPIRLQNHKPQGNTLHNCKLHFLTAL